MSTIEPRLIALLNNDTVTYSTSPSLELPPLQDPNILKASGRPLALEPDASKRNGASQHQNLHSAVDGEDGAVNTSGRSQRALGNSSPQSLRKILDNDSGPTSVLSTKKRTIESSKEDFVQLPQPIKKQKAAKQVVPPIIIGLFQPPPQETVFPPIASSAFHDSHGRNSLNTVVPPRLKEVQETARIEDPSTPVDNKKPTGKDKQKRDVRARKKWTEEETNNLLLGVHKHGVGKWTDILEDSSFAFNGRSGVDLKDRFRTCCPDELRSGSKDPRFKKPTLDVIPRKSKSSLMSENILIDEDEFGSKDVGSDSNIPKERKTRAHRKKVEDLAQLGIEGPFQKSQRRERRPFTEEDDREILRGYEIYGPAWTRIQRDSRFHLQSRQATDLRDRFRNKHADKIRSSKDDHKEPQMQAFRPKEKQIAPLQPLALQSSSSREGLRIHEICDDDMPSRVLPQTSNYNFGDNLVFAAQPPESLAYEWSSSEMDASRMLLESSEPWIEPAAPERERQSFMNLNYLLTSNQDDIPLPSTFWTLLTEQMSIPTSGPVDQDAVFDEPL